nr:hypothetical protein [Tanacetum cinerariifolium]
MAWQTDYCTMKEGMSILRGRKSVPGMNSSAREMERGYYSTFISGGGFDSRRRLVMVDLSYIEEPEAILDRQDRVMRKKTILFIKILWRNHSKREAT